MCFSSGTLYVHAPLKWGAPLEPLEAAAKSQPVASARQGRAAQLARPHKCCSDAAVQPQLCLEPESGCGPAGLLSCWLGSREQPVSVSWEQIMLQAPVCLILAAVVCPHDFEVQTEAGARST